MSGGSYNYTYSKIHHMADLMREKANDRWEELHDPKNGVDLVVRLRFADLLDEVAVACRAIEWNDSGDGHPDEAGLLKKLLGDRK